MARKSKTQKEDEKLLKEHIKMSKQEYEIYAKFMGINKRRNNNTLEYIIITGLIALAWIVAYIFGGV